MTSTTQSNGPPPTMLGRYRVVRRLGAGGMAEVFLVKSTGAEGIEKLLVLKRVLPTFARSAKFRAMFTDEARVAMRLNHPNIVQVFDFQSVRDEFLLAMELVDGLDLGRLVSSAKRTSHRIPYGLCAYVVAEVAKGLDYAHNRKDESGQPMEIVHRDVSPQNVLISFEGSVKVADFGIARARLVTEETGVIKGKFAYMSPEQARGARVDRRSDVYSLGVLLAELLMDRAMYPGQSGLDVLDLVRLGKLTLPRSVDPKVPEDLERIVKQATEFDPEARFQSARSLAGAIAQFLHAQNEVFDGEALEQYLTKVAPRDVTSPDASRDDRARGAGTVATAIAAPQALNEKEIRERRHVVVLGGTVQSGTENETGSQVAVGQEAARVLADIAYKADAVLDWSAGALPSTERRRFRFVLGLGRVTVHDPLRATRLALDVLDALHGLSADLLAPVSASLGLSRGVVSTARDSNGRLVRYEAVGNVLEVAQRLADVGSAGETLATGEVFRAARRDFAFDDKEVREIAMPEGAEPRVVRAYRLRGARTREERAFEALSVGTGDGVLQGREPEMRELSDAYADALGQRKSAFITVTGELGVGKSALVEATLSTLEPKPRVLRAECAFGLSDVPYAATAELLREALDIGSDTTPREARAKLREFVAKLPREEDRGYVVAALEPLVAPTGPAKEAGEDRGRTVLRALRLVLGALAARGPLLVLLESLQWIDSPSLELLTGLVNRVYDLPLVVLLVTRPDPRIDKALAGVPRLEVGELGLDERRKLIRARFGGARVPPDVEQAIMERAGGNPYFVNELVEALTERGVVAIEGQGEGRRVVRKAGPIVLPTTLEGAVAARLGDLPADTRLALRWLSVVGPGLRSEDYALLSGRELDAALADLEERGLAQTRNGIWELPSAVVRSVAFEAIEPNDRVRMHRRVGAHLSTLDPPAPPARIALHLEKAGDLVEAAQQYAAAGAAAAAAYAKRDALRLYARALSLLPPEDVDRFALHAAREDILRGTSRRHERLLELEAMRALAERAASPTQRATAFNRLARYELDEGRTAGVEALLRRALDAAIDAGFAPAEVESLRLSAQLARETGDVQKALDAADRALVRCGLSAELLEARAGVLVQRGMLLRRLNRVDEAIDATAEAVAIFRRLGERSQESHALNSLAVGLLSAGEFEDAISILCASIVIDRETGDRFMLGNKLSNVGQLYAELGDVARAEAFIQRAMEAFEALGERAALADTLAALAELQLEQSHDVSAAEATLERARRISESSNDPYDLARERLVRAELLLHRQRETEAAASAREAVSHARSAGMVSYELFGLALQADALARAGRVDEAREAAKAARARLGSSTTIERAERILFHVARAFQTIGDASAAEDARRAARSVIETRLALIQDPAVRDRYLQTVPVRGVTAEAP